MPSTSPAPAGLNERLLHRLAESGARLTPTRAAVLRALTSRSDGFTIEELCGDVRPVGRATVFRTVRLLLQEGIVCKLAMGDATPRYALSRSGHHHHAVCLRCGAVDDFRGCDLDDLVQRVAAAAESEVLGHRLEGYVVCAQFRRNGASGSPPSDYRARHQEPHPAE